MTDLLKTIREREKTIAVIFALCLISFVLGNIFARINLAKNAEFPFYGDGYYWMGNDCWAYAPFTLEALLEAKKDCTHE